MFRCPAEGRIAVPLPVLRVQGQKGKQVDRGFEYIETVAGSSPVKTAPGIAALHIAPVTFALSVESTLVGMTGNAVFIESDEHGVVILLCLIFGQFPAFINQPLLGKGVEDFTADVPLLEQVGIHPPHGLVSGRQGKFFRLLLFFFPR